MIESREEQREGSARATSELGREREVRSSGASARSAQEGGRDRSESLSRAKKMAMAAVMTVSAMLPSNLVAGIQARASELNPSVVSSVVDKLQNPGALRDWVNMEFAIDCVKPEGSHEDALSKEALGNFMAILDGAHGSTKQEIADSSLAVVQSLFATTEETRLIAEESGRNFTSREIDALEACRRLSAIAAASKAEGCPLVTAVPSQCASFGNLLKI